MLVLSTKLLEVWLVLTCHLVRQHLVIWCKNRNFVPFTVWCKNKNLLPFLIQKYIWAMPHNIFSFLNHVIWRLVSFHMSFCEATCSDLEQKQKFCSVYNLVKKRKLIAFFDSKAHVSNAAQHFLLIEQGYLKFG